MTTIQAPVAVPGSLGAAGTATGPRAIGVDLSLTATGIASSLGWCLTHGRDKLTVASRPLADRVAGLHTLAAELLEHIGHPDLVLIEAPALSRSRGGVFERGYLWFQVVHALEARGIPVVDVVPQQVKQFITGKGSATKGEVLVETARRLPQFDTRGDDNMADAAVMAAMGADLLGAPIVKLPSTYRAALDKVRPRLPEAVTS